MKTRKSKNQYKRKQKNAPSLDATPKTPQSVNRSRRIHFRRTEKMKYHFMDVIEQCCENNRALIFEEYNGNYTHFQNGGRMKISQPLFKMAYRMAVKESLPTYVYDVAEQLEMNGR